MNCELIGWCALKPEVQAAWAQAVLSVVAVGIAIYVPAKIEGRQRHRSFYAITGLLVAIAERVAELFSKVTSPPNSDWSRDRRSGAQEAHRCACHDPCA